MPGRISVGTIGYRYGFNGKENDNEVKGSGNSQDYGLRIYDNRLAKFLSVDPLTKDYSELTPYQFASNSPILFIDIDGAEGGLNSLSFGLTTALNPATGIAITKGTGKFLESIGRGTVELGIAILNSAGTVATGVYNASTVYIPQTFGFNGGKEAQVLTTEGFKTFGGAEHIQIQNKSGGAIGTALATAIAGELTVGIAIEGFAATSSALRKISTPVGIRAQSASKAATAAIQEVNSGVTLYRIGTKGLSKTGPEAQFWSLENPLTNPEAYAIKYNIPLKNIKNADFIETATLKPGAKFVTQEAGHAPSSANSGKGIEVVVEKGGTTNNVVTPIKK